MSFKNQNMVCTVCNCLYNSYSLDKNLIEVHPNIHVCSNFCGKYIDQNLPIEFYEWFLELRNIYRIDHFNKYGRAEGWDYDDYNPTIENLIEMKPEVFRKQPIINVPRGCYHPTGWEIYYWKNGYSPADAKNRRNGLIFEITGVNYDDLVQNIPCSNYWDDRCALCEDGFPKKWD